MVNVEHIFPGQNFGVYENLAVDEWLFHESERTGRAFLRVYTFPQPAIYLSQDQRVDDLRHENLDGIPYTRRWTGGGGAILCDRNVVGYTVIVPLSEAKEQTDAHRKFGGKVRDVLLSKGLENVELWNEFSVRINDQIIAGHGQRHGSKSFLYHGILALYPWDFDKLSLLLNLPPGEIEVIRKLPSVNDFVPLTHEEFSRDLIQKFGAVTLNDALFEQECLEEAKKLVQEKYANPEWIQKGQGKQYKGLGFCFVAIRPPEKRGSKEHKKL